MDFQILYWHWILIGVVLIGLEMFTLSFTVFWFGVVAVIVGILLYLFPALPLEILLLGWSVGALLLAVLWFKYIKPLSGRKTLTPADISQLQGEVGMVIKANNNQELRGRLRFPAALFGDDEWDMIADTVLDVGDKVKIIDAVDNCLTVKKL